MLKAINFSKIQKMNIILILIIYTVSILYHIENIRDNVIYRICILESGCFLIPILHFTLTILLFYHVIVKIMYFIRKTENIT